MVTREYRKGSPFRWWKQLVFDTTIAIFSIESCLSPRLFQARQQHLIIKSRVARHPIEDIRIQTTLIPPILRDASTRDGRQRKPRQKDMALPTKRHLNRRLGTRSHPHSLTQPRQLDNRYCSSFSWKRIRLKQSYAGIDAIRLVVVIVS